MLSRDWYAANCCEANWRVTNQDTRYASWVAVSFCNTGCPELLSASKVGLGRASRFLCPAEFGHDNSTCQETAAGLIELEKKIKRLGKFRVPKHT